MVPAHLPFLKKINSFFCEVYAELLLFGDKPRKKNLKTLIFWLRGGVRRESVLFPKSSSRSENNFRNTIFSTLLTWGILFE